MAEVVQSSSTHFSGEEALLDAYDLQWKAIDIRMEKLRNECERMILEYEVEMKQQMYLRECEDLMRLTTAEHERKQEKLERELQEKDRQLQDAKTEEQLRSSREKQEREKEQEEKEMEAKAAKEAKLKATAAAQKKAKAIEEKTVAAQKKIKAIEEKPVVEKKAKKVKVAAPLSPPVYSPEEEVDEKKDEPTNAADDDLLDILTQDQEYESEDFHGDAPSLSLIHPESPAMMSPKRLKKHKDAQLNRLRVITQPVEEPSPEPKMNAFSDSSASSPPPIVATPPAKRALKRRKTAVSPAVSPSASAARATVAQVNAEKIAHRVEPESAVVEVKTKTKTKGKKTIEELKVAESVEKSADIGQGEPELAKAAKKKTAAVKPAKKKPSKSPVPVEEPEKLAMEEEDANEPEEEETVAKPRSKAKNSTKKTAEATLPVGGAVTGRSKARQSAKAAASRDAAEEHIRQMTGFTAIHDIATPKVPRKKMGMDGKMKKQMNDLAAKRAEFQQIMSETSTTAPTADEGEFEPSGNKKRRRRENEMDEFQTPKPKAKKPKTKTTKATQQFANDELNIMKSPVPLLRAKIAEKKKQEQANKLKRTASQRDDVEEQEPVYGSPARAVPASSVPAAQSKSNEKSTVGAISPASDYASRWLNSGLVTRAKKTVVKPVAGRKPTKPAALWGGGSAGGASFFDAFVNSAAPVIPRLKTTSQNPRD